MRRLFFASLTICLFAVIASAQSFSSMGGIVTDPNGAVVAGATVKLTDTKTGQDQTTTTNDNGVYSFVKISPGTGYSLTVTAQGFQTFVITDIALGVGTVETHNVTLPVGAVSNTVTVTSGGEATLNTTDATIGNVIDQRRLAELPIQLRNSPAALIGLQPGVVGNNVGAGTTNRVGSVTGSRADQGNITIDGIDANDQATGQAFATVGNAPIDAIQEFRAVTTNPNSSEGRSSGGQIQLVTKSGTNDFHGSVREFNRTALTAANSFFNNRAGRRADGTLVSPRPQLTRNQFGGSLGGPVIKNHLFFFQDYEGRRDAQGVSYTRTVPLDSFRAGSISYIRTGLNNAGATCAASSRNTSTPECIATLTPAQVAALDPRLIGGSAALLAFINTRYPRANDLTLGDGINTGGFRFNAPSHRADNTYTTRIDWNANDNHKVFGRFNFARRLQTDTVNTVAAQFEGDPESGQIAVQDYAWVVGHTWTLGADKTNQATVGVTRSGLRFPRPFQPAFPQVFTFGPLTAPYASISEQTRFVPVPTIRDDFTWIKGAHTLAFGGQWKPIHQRSSLTNDFNFATVGIGGLTSALDPSLRPANIRTGSVTGFDSAFAFLLGRYASIATNYNYSPAGTPFAPGTGKQRDFKYSEYEIYAQDNWKARNDLTLTFGARYQYYSVPFEVNGFQACNDTDFNNLIALRFRNAANGVSGVDAEPFLRYDLCGKANSSRGFSEPDLNNIGPRLSFAYNPSFKSGVLGALFGDRKTVVRGGGSVVYDRVGGGITFIQDQVSYLFDNSATRLFGNVDPRTALLNDPRFTSITTLPLVPAAPVITHPFTPFVTGGFPDGNATGEFNYAIDQHFRTPYSIEYSFGIQRELPGNFILDASYVGRQSRKLFSQADAAQILDFRDNASGQFMLNALNRLQAEIQANPVGTQNGTVAVTNQAWFENQFSSAFGASCVAVLGRSCTSFLARNATTNQLVLRGDTSDLMQLLYASGFLNPNVGMSSQFSTNIYISNQGAGSYNGLLVSLRKRFSQGLQFDANYTWSNSIDNGSSVVNTVSGGLVCDLRNLKVCRGPSDFDIRHLFNANFIYELPFGKGKSFGGSSNGLVDRIIGGWEVTGIFTARSGVPFSVTSGTAFPVGFNFLSPAVSQGNPGTLVQDIHDQGANIQFFTNPLAVFDLAPANIRNGSVRFPYHGEIGNRNNLRGPRFWNLDTAVLKNIKISEKWGRIQLRWESYNAFNHNVFNTPGTVSITSASLGFVTSSATAPREMQFAIRWDF